MMNEPHAIASPILPTGFPFAKTVEDPIARIESWVSGIAGHVWDIQWSPTLCTGLPSAKTSPEA